MVQRREVEVAASPFYTVDDWAMLPADRTQVVDGDVELADGISVLHTPGHTPGHQAVVIRSTADTIVIAGQCVMRAAEWSADQPSTANLHDETHRDLAAESIARLRALKPSRVYFSHDRGVTQ